jgi:hypothetical protein
MKRLAQQGLIGSGKSVRYCYHPKLFKKIGKLQSLDHIWQYYHLGDNSRTWQVILN